jgi:16S rRNA (uracil1498-N3)-methyltransferase
LAESDGFDGLRLVLNPEAGASLRSLGETRGAVTCLVGPEGGFTPGEFAAAASRGYRPLRLGPRTLRADTAGLAASAALLALWGDY